MRIYLQDEKYGDFDDYPLMYFYIEDSREICEMMDRVRKSKGFAPLFDMDDPDVCTEGWYDVYCLVDVEQGKCLQFQVTVVTHGMTDDNEATYYYGGDAPCKNSISIDGDAGIDLDDIYRQIERQIDMDEIAREGREDWAS